MSENMGSWIITGKTVGLQNYFVEQEKKTKACVCESVLLMCFEVHDQISFFFIV